MINIFIYCFIINSISAEQVKSHTMTSIDMNVDSSGIIKNATHEELSLSDHILEHMLNIFSKKNTAKLKPDENIKVVIKTIIDDSNIPNSLITIDNGPGFKDLEHLKCALSFGTSDRSGTNNRGCGSKLMFIQKTFINKIKGGSGLVISKNHTGIQGYILNRKSHDVMPQMTLMDSDVINEVMNNQLLNDMFLHTFELNMEDIPRFTIYFSNAFYKTTCTDILKKIKILHENYASLDAVIDEDLKNKLAIHMSKILFKTSHEININGQLLEYNLLMGSPDYYPHPAKINQCKIAVTSYKTKTTTKYIIYLEKPSFGLEPGYYEIKMSKFKKNCNIGDLFGTAMRKCKFVSLLKEKRDMNVAMEFNINIMDIGKDNWHEHPLNLPGKHSSDYKRIYISIDDTIIAAPKYTRKLNDWPHMRIGIDIRSEGISQENIEQIINLNKHKAKSNINEKTTKLIDIITSLFEKEHGSKNTKTKTTRKSFPQSTVLDSLKHSHGRDARTGVPLADGLYDINHKDSDNSNIAPDNCEILDPTVHAHITRNTESKNTIKVEPEKYVVSEIRRFWAADCLTHSTKNSLIMTLIGDLSKSDRDALMCNLSTGL